ncbi:DUF6370 family protein [Flavobacterium sp.]|uniref:DUF6370 family protein n=1 Tax=Flavobacterium sp. TaxID=239 RepID=UPI00248A8464|nr:DUF6370 family protein [Flavobacterium sp.]MDI1316402.1 DUF6370 family protein [Flavobacterium sp.]
MKKIISVLVLFVCLSVNAQDTPKTQTVEAACGQCQFGMTDKKGCDLAVRIDGKSYFVEGTDINKHGDAHGKDGFCSTVRKAEVTGQVKGEKFIASSFKLLPVEAQGHTDHTGHKH